MTLGGGGVLGSTDKGGRKLQNGPRAVSDVVVMASFPGGETISTLGGKRSKLGGLFW